MVGNGDKLDAILSAPMYIRQNTVYYFYVLPITRTDVVLGIQWLKSLGSIATACANLSMQFKWLGSSITLQGIHQNSISKISSKQLKRLQTTKSISGFYHLNMTIATSNDTTNLQVVHPNIDPILKKFQELFQEPQGVSPVLSNSHNVRLIPQSEPVSIRFYKYRYFQ